MLYPVDVFRGQGDLSRGVSVSSSSFKIPLPYFSPAQFSFPFSGGREYRQYLFNPLLVEWTFFSFLTSSQPPSSPL